MSEWMPGSAGEAPDYLGMHGGIVALVEAARHAAARSVNAVMTASYWEIGRRIVEFEQGGRNRAAYGDALIDRLSADLGARFGRGFSRQNLQQMRLFYLCWPLNRMCQTPSGKCAGPGAAQTVPEASPDLPALAQSFPLPWSAYVRLLAVKSEAARRFYETEALRCGWSVRQLDRQVNSQFYERISLSMTSRSSGASAA